MGDPLKDVEDRKAQLDIGVFGFRVFQGAKEEGATVVEAYLTTCAFFVGLFTAKSQEEEEGGDGESQD